MWFGPVTCLSISPKAVLQGLSDTAYSHLNIDDFEHRFKSYSSVATHRRDIIFECRLGCRLTSNINATSPQSKKDLVKRLHVIFMQWKIGWWEGVWEHKATRDYRNSNSCFQLTIQTNGYLAITVSRPKLPLFTGFYHSFCHFQYETRWEVCDQSWGGALGTRLGLSYFMWTTVISSCSWIRWAEGQFWPDWYTTA